MRLFSAIFERSLFYNFACCKDYGMVDLNLIVVTLTALLCLVLMICQVYANRRNSALVSFSTEYLPLCLMHLAVLSISCSCAGSDGIYALVVNLLSGISPLLLLASSFLPRNNMTIILVIVLGFVPDALYLYFILYADMSFTPAFYGKCALAASSVPVIYCLVSIWVYIRRIRNVVQKTTVWTILSLCVDVVYVVCIAGIAVMFYVSTGLSLTCVRIMSFLCFILLLPAVAALVYRISTDSLFFIMRKHETVILESLNDMPADMANGRASPEEVYKEIFERIVKHFETEMPYLSGNLVIEDLVKVVFANKLYISRSISRCTGRNFCQFVNYYRVRHSVEVFRQNPDLKVGELAAQCGFNSVGSFTMAFKLYMNENPSDWIRQERSRLIKSR